MVSGTACKDVSVGYLEGFMALLQNFDIKYQIF